MSHHLTQQLQAQGHRITPQRAAILRVIEQSDKHLTPVEVYQLTKKSLPEITEPTVYRTLTFFASQGLVMVAHMGNGQLVYEAAGHEHHHLVCRECNYSLEIDHSILEPLYQQLKESTGYEVDSIHVTFFGLCPHCRENQEEVES